ncbi:hypothetical protein CEUSTIGMA_g5317.t1 [Chlamydomonas eustigma]|uniref:Uncharacterized protein n=1 Tax=Chlamydomonas eustigma TaxID=1157962 RepID=A0A250X481_9CHLO|nr:hypothetical protein CEUSTIGMA_g5317.t1 [Chlamydomonas eustigma]|eukprot:GAX77875.1 hypothetical protein CEUSTIGMA_g5317.t1 [Chlamydomonas eustigma]
MLVEDILGKDPQLQWELTLRDIQLIKNTQTAATVVNCATGRILTQNPTSMAILGIHGASHAVHKTGPHAPSSKALTITLVTSPNRLPSDRPVSVQLHCSPYSGWDFSVHQRRMRAHVEGDYSYIHLLFDQNKDELESLESETRLNIFHTRLEITHPVLRSFMCLHGEGQEAFYDVQISVTHGPIAYEKVFIVSKVDVTEAVLEKCELQHAYDKLTEEKQRAMALLHRQHELIECFGKVNEAALRSSDGKRKSAAHLMDNVFMHMTEGAGDVKEKIELNELLGQGSFGKVFKGLWRGLLLLLSS